MNFSKPKTKPKRFKRIKYFIRKKTFFPRITPILLRNSKSVVQSVTKVSSIKSKYKKGIIDYKNVVLLRKYVTPEGKIIPKRITHLTAKQQRYMARAIKHARMMGFLPFMSVAKSKYKPEKSLYYHPTIPDIPDKKKR